MMGQFHQARGFALEPVVVIILLIGRGACSAAQRVGPRLSRSVGHEPQTSKTGATR